MSASYWFTSDEGVPESNSTLIPVMTLEHLSEARRLLGQYDEAYAALSRHRQALRAWDGPSLTSMRLEILLAAELPHAVAAGMAACEEAQALNRHQGPELANRLIERQTLTARLHALITEQQREQGDAEARIQALEHLRPLADQILATRAHLYRLLARQAEQRGRGLAGLWGALSGQAATLQREIDQARHTEEEGLTAYSLRATSLGLRPAPSPAELGTRVAEAKRSLTERMRRVDTERQALEARRQELDVWLRDTQGRLTEAEAHAAETWTNAQRLHNVPDWPVWENIWQQREEVRRLWRAGTGARQLLQEATRSLERLWSGWPSDLQGVDALRRVLPQIEGAWLAREAHAQEAARRTGEQTQRTAFLEILHLRWAALAAEERARDERRQAEQARAERLYLQEEARGARKAEAAPPATSHPRVHADSGERPLAYPAQPASSPSFPVLERYQVESARLLLVRHGAAAGQAAMCQEALEEWAGPGLNATRLAVLVSQPLPPALVQALAEWEEVRDPTPGSRTGLEQEDHDHRALRWETVWSELRRTLGVPAHPRDWQRLWEGRAKAQALWIQWKQAQERMGQLEAEMAPLWSGWPLPEQNAAALRLALERVEAGAGPGPVQPAPVSRSGGAAPSKWLPTASPVPPPPMPGRRGEPARPTPSAEHPAPAPVPRPPLPGQAAPSRSPSAPRLSQSPPSPPTSNPPGSVPPQPSIGAGLDAEGWSRSLPGPAKAQPVLPVPPPVHGRPTPVVNLPLSGPPLPGVAVPPKPTATAHNPGPSLAGASAFPPVPVTVTAPSPRAELPAPPLQGRSGPPSTPLLASPLPGVARPPVSVPPLPPTPQRIRMPGPVLPGQARSPDPATPEPLLPPGRLTRRQRAVRVAVRIGEQYNWQRGFKLLADALDQERWGQLRESIEREIAQGMTPEEFELMLQLRAYWHEQTHFQSPYTSRYDSLPWSLGLALIRRSAGVPCLDEMIILLDRLYEYAEVACSKRALPAFAQRLGAILDWADPDVDLEYWLCAQEARCFSR